MVPDIPFTVIDSTNNISRVYFNLTPQMRSLMVAEFRAPYFESIFDAMGTKHEGISEEPEVFDIDYTEADVQNID